MYEADADEYKKITRNSKPLLNKDTTGAEKILEYIKRNNIGIITYNDAAFPKRVKALTNSPLVLYYIGRLYDFDATPSVGVVGTRNYSKLGEQVTKRVSYDLARSGFTIISGLARGIDSFSHKAALYNKSMTTAVLGCGIDVIYPPENRELTLRLHENGLVITEFAPGTAPFAQNFPARNRIISALSDCIFVSECGQRSGTLITANHAFACGTPVYMWDKLCVGVREHLAAKGAMSIENADDITADFIKRYPQLRFVRDLKQDKAPEPDDKIVTVQQPESFKDAQKPQKNEAPAPKKPVPWVDIELDETERMILKRLKRGAADVDELACEGADVSDILRAASILEINGLISSVAGGKYVINN